MNEQPYVNGAAAASVSALATALATQQQHTSNSTNPNRVRLYEKLRGVYRAVHYVQKDKRNSFHGYTYASEAAIKAALHDAFADCGLILLPPRILEVKDEPRTGEKDKQTFLTTIRIVITIADTETGETVEGEVYGRGIDNQDKGIYKAMTGALKYLLTTTFLIATGDDPEADQSGENEPQQRQQRQRRMNPAGAAVAERKIAEGDPSTSKPWKTLGEMKRMFAALREVVGEVAFLDEIGRYQWKSIDDAVRLYGAAEGNEALKMSVTSQLVQCYHHLDHLANRPRVVA